MSSDIRTVQTLGGWMAKFNGWRAILVTGWGETEKQAVDALFREWTKHVKLGKKLTGAR